MKHGYKGTPEYRAWCSMLSRCRNPNVPAYRNYGGRGISVCLRWMQFVNFLSDVGRKPGGGYDLDRINSNGNYEPGNVRWATRKQGSQNKRTNILIEINGTTKSAAEWAAIAGVDRHTVAKRYKAGVRGSFLLASNLRRGRARVLASLASR